MSELVRLKKKEIEKEKRRKTWKGVIPTASSFEWVGLRNNVRKEGGEKK
jgi:hypothetical protein